MYDVEEITENTGSANRTFSVMHNMQPYTVVKKGNDLTFVEYGETGKNDELARGILQATQNYIDKEEK